MRRAISAPAFLFIVFFSVAVSGEDKDIQRDAQRGLVVCQDAHGVGFFRRGECPDRFFMSSCPPGQTCSVDGICPDHSKHDPKFSTTACYAYLKDRLGHESTQVNYCEVTNLKDTVGRARFPSGLLCWDRNCNGHCDKGDLLTTEDLNGDGFCSASDCREQCWDLNKNFFCDPDEDQNGDKKCTDDDCPKCYDTNHNLKCDLPAEDLNGDGICDEKDCPECWDTNHDLKCTLPDEDLNHDGACNQDDCNTQCWDLNANGHCDMSQGLNEDVDGDGKCTIADCVTPLCSDRNHNGACDPEEDRNHDNICNNLDCGRVRANPVRTAGQEGRIVPVSAPVGRATLTDISPGRYDVAATLSLSDDFVAGESVDCRITDGFGFDATPRLAQLSTTMKGDFVLAAPMVVVNSGTISLRCRSSLGNTSVVRVMAHSTSGLRLTAEPLDDEPAQ